MTGIACHRRGDTEDCPARFTIRASYSPALLALLPLRDDVRRERPAPLRPDGQAAGFVMKSVTQEQTHCPLVQGVLFDPLGRQACDRLLVHVTLACHSCLPWEGTPRDVSCLDRMTQGLPENRPRKRELVAVCLVRRQFQGLPWRKGDRVGHQNDSFQSVQPVHAREGQPRAIPDVPEEHPAVRCRQRRGTITIGNPVHRAFEPTATYLQRGSQLLLPVTRACFQPTTLTFRTLQGNHIVSTHSGSDQRVDRARVWRGQQSSLVNVDAWSCRKTDVTGESVEAWIGLRVQSTCCSVIRHCLETIED